VYLTEDLDWVVMVSSDLIDRFERRGSMVRKCVKGVNCG